MTDKMVYSYQVMSQSGKVYMRRIGSARVNPDGSITVALDEETTCKSLLILDYVERKDNGA